MRIQHNIMAMNAYRNYTNNTSALSKNLEKLSSGYRINRAGDDAAGLAISEKMRAQITGLSAAQKNVKDGISLVKTAEGATQEIHDMLNRMVYLAEQSANGTYQDEVDREAITDEFEALKSEINRIADSSNFNGIKLLDGSLAEKTAVMNENNLPVTHVQDGQMTGKPQQAVITVDLRRMEWTNNNATTADTTTSLSLGGQVLTATGISIAANGGKLTGAEYAEKFMAAGVTAGVWTDKDSNKWDVTNDNGLLTFTQKTAKDFTAGTPFELTVTNKTDTVDNHGNVQAVTVLTEGVSAAGRVFAQGKFDLANANIKDGTTLKIGDTTYTFAVGKDSKFKDVANVVDLTDQTKAVIDSNADLSKIAAERLSKVAEGNKNLFVETDGNTSMVFLTEKEGGIDYDVNNLGPGADKNAQTKDVADAAWNGLVKVGEIDLENTSNGLTLQIGDTSDSFNQLRVSVADMHTKALGLDGLSLGTQEGAQKAVQSIKDAINAVSTTRGKLGATQNRLEHTQNNLSVMKENIQDAEATIRDTDIAEEMMAYTKNNILVQSAQAMLAQANQIPQGVLQLLG